MTSHRRSARGWLLSLLLTGCVSDAYQDNATHHQGLSQEIKRLTTAEPQEKVKRVARPPKALLPLTLDATPDWLGEAVTLSVVDMPLSVVLEELLAGTGAPLYFEESVDPNTPVSLNFSGGRDEVMNALSRSMGYGLSVSEGRVVVSSTVTRTFYLNQPTGQMNAQIGSTGTASPENAATVEGQYLNVVYDAIDVVSEIEAAVKNVLGGNEKAKEWVSASLSTSSITVTTTPDKMRLVEQLVNEHISRIRRQVILDVRVIEFRSNLGTERGIDWNLVYESGDGLLSFFVPGTNTVSQEAGYGLAFQGTGRWSGSQALIKVLEKQGTVSTETPITALLMNNQPARITQQNVIPYLYEASSESSEGVISASVTRREEVEGVDFMAVANVQDDEVFLRLSGQLQKITASETKQVEQIDLQFLSKSKSEITVPNRLRYGQTYVIAAIKQTARTNERSESFWIPWLGGTGSQTHTIETLVLLTPRKVN